MSRTDTHRPYAVQQADPYGRHRWRRLQERGTEPPVLIPMYRTCNCTVPGCSNHDQYRAERRRDRHTWRQRMWRENSMEG